MRKYLNLRANIALGLTFAFLANIFGPVPVAQAEDFHLPAPGVMVHLSPEFNPAILKGIKVHPDNPFRFDFILDVGDGSKPSQEGRLMNPPLREESTKLIKYFLASLTIPEKDLWVNLSPYEKNRIVPESFGQTEMGRDLLAEDYMLKQITASLMYPEDEIGKKFWKRIYEEAYKKFGTTNIPVNTFNKVWIVPDKAVVYENTKAGTAYVVESKLKVMLEQDYLSLQKHTFARNDVASVGGNIVREIIIPELTKKVNENKNFAQLRQVYNSLILATWYKKKIKDSILAQVYEDKKKVVGIDYKNSLNIEDIYRCYLQAFKKGVFNYIKEESNSLSQKTIPRKYFSGGFDAALIAPLLVDANEDQLPQKIDRAEIVTVDCALADTSGEEKSALVQMAPDQGMRAAQVKKIIEYEGDDPADVMETSSDELLIGKIYHSSGRRVLLTPLADLYERVFDRLHEVLRNKYEKETAHGAGVSQMSINNWSNGKGIFRDSRRKLIPHLIRELRLEEKAQFWKDIDGVWESLRKNLKNAIGPQKWEKVALEIGIDPLRLKNFLKGQNDLNYKEIRIVESYVVNRSPVDNQAKILRSIEDLRLHFNAMLDRLLTDKSTSLLEKQLGISRKTVLKLMRDKELPAPKYKDGLIDILIKELKLKGKEKEKLEELKDWYGLFYYFLIQAKQKRGNLQAIAQQAGIPLPALSTIISMAKGGNESHVKIKDLIKYTDAIIQVFDLERESRPLRQVSRWYRQMQRLLSIAGQRGQFSNIAERMTVLSEEKVTPEILTAWAEGKSQPDIEQCKRLVPILDVEFRISSAGSELWELDFWYTEFRRTLSNYVKKEKEGAINELVRQIEWETGFKLEPSTIYRWINKRENYPRPHEPNVVYGQIVADYLIRYFGLDRDDRAMDSTAQNDAAMMSLEEKDTQARISGLIAAVGKTFQAKKESIQEIKGKYLGTTHLDGVLRIDMDGYSFNWKMLKDNGIRYRTIVDDIDIVNGRYKITIRFEKDPRFPSRGKVPPPRVFEIGDYKREIFLKDKVKAGPQIRTVFDIIPENEIALFIFGNIIDHPDAFDHSDTLGVRKLVDELNSISGYLMGETDIGGKLSLSFGLGEDFPYAWPVLGSRDFNNYKVFFEKASVNEDGFCDFTVKLIKNDGTSMERSFETGRFLREVMKKRGEGRESQADEKRAVERESKKVLDIVPRNEIARQILSIAISRDYTLIRSGGFEIKEELSLKEIPVRGHISISLTPVEKNDQFVEYKPYDWYLLGFEGWNAYIVQGGRNRKGYLEYEVRFDKEGEPTFKRTFEIGRVKTILKPMIEGKGNPRTIYEITAKEDAGRKIFTDILFGSGKYDPKRISKQLRGIQNYIIGQTNASGVGNFTVNGHTYTPYFGPKESGWQLKMGNVEIIDGKVQFKLGYSQDGRDPLERTFEISGAKAKAKARDGSAIDVFGIKAITPLQAAVVELKKTTAIEGPGSAEKPERVMLGGKEQRVLDRELMDRFDGSNWKKSGPTVLLEDYDISLLRNLKNILVQSGYRVFYVQSRGQMESYLRLHPEIGLVAAGDQPVNGILGERRFLNISDFLNGDEELDRDGEQRFLDSAKNLLPVDLAQMTGTTTADKGGIDLTPPNMNLQTRNNNGEIKFHIDPAMLQQLRNAPGFVPVIIHIEPMVDLRKFLGVTG